MATLLTSTTIPCDVIPNNKIYHSSLANTSYINTNTQSIKESSSLAKIYSSKLKATSLDTNEVSKKIKNTNNNFVSNKVLSASNRVCCKSSSMKYIEKTNKNLKLSKDKIIKSEKYKNMSNLDVKIESNSQNNSKKVENKKIINNNNNKLNGSSKKKINNNNSNNNNSSSIKNINQKIKTKTNIKLNSKAINLQDVTTQTQNPRLQSNNVSKKIINIRNQKKSPSKPITKLKLPTKNIPNTFSFSKLSLNNTYNKSKNSNDKYLDKYFSNYSYNPEFSKKYRVKEEMGRGGFGLVFVAERISDGVEVAVKFIIKEKVPVSAWIKDPDLGIIPRECYILKHINHPSIIKYLDCYSDRKYFYLVMELHGSSWSKSNTYKNNYPNENDDNNNKMYTSLINAAALKTNNNFHVGKVRPSMDLFECIESYFECFDENQARYIFIQLLTAIKYLNSLSIIHRDIKDENILIDKDLNIKLIDFGAAIQIKGGRVYDRFVGTVPYIAPEIINGQEYGSLTQDIYSLGVLLHLLIYGELPEIKLNKDDTSTLNLPQCTIKGNYCSEEVRHLIRWMLQKSPSSRPTLDEILNHDWIKANKN